MCVYLIYGISSGWFAVGHHEQVLVIVHGVQVLPPCMHELVQRLCVLRCDLHGSAITVSGPGLVVRRLVLDHPLCFLADQRLAQLQLAARTTLPDALSAPLSLVARRSCGTVAAPNGALAVRDTAENGDDEEALVVLCHCLGRTRVAAGCGGAAL
jgi:hypothetical protein